MALPIAVAANWVIPPAVEVAARLVVAMMLPSSSPALLSRITTRVPSAATVLAKEFPALFRITTPLGVPPDWAVEVAKKEAVPATPRAELVDCW